MKPQSPDEPSTPTGGDAEVVRCLTARLAGALLVMALVAGILISTLIYPPAATGAVVASIALVARLGLAASGSGD
ncbi:MAG TPA: hypothetical protein VL691_19040 [Vicinamibacteria bacterium]|nr:hypothetical protein [Vicinamibacteria bacterium]